MKKIMTRIKRDDSCPNCGQDRCVDLFDSNNKPIHYTILLDKIEDNMNSNIDLSNSRIQYAKCLCCEKKYSIDWSVSLKIPRPFYLSYFKDLMLDLYFNK